MSASCQDYGLEPHGWKIANNEQNFHDVHRKCTAKASQVGGFNCSRESPRNHMSTCFSFDNEAMPCSIMCNALEDY
jgi:hypothetical protein